LTSTRVQYAPRPPPFLPPDRPFLTRLPVAPTQVTAIPPDGNGTQSPQTAPRPNGIRTSQTANKAIGLPTPEEFGINVEPYDKGCLVDKVMLLSDKAKLEDIHARHAPPAPRQGGHAASQWTCCRVGAPAGGRGGRRRRRMQLHDQLRRTRSLAHLRLSFTSRDKCETLAHTHAVQRVRGCDPRRACK